MEMQKHASLTGIDVHTPFSFVFATHAAKDSSVGYLPEDVKKLAVVEADHTFFILINNSPIT